MLKIDLCGNWTGQCVDKAFSFNAEVPGCAHTDLIKAKKTVSDLYWRDNADSVQWIENSDFKYSKDFCVEALGENAKLVFECLDTYCDVFLNGISLGYCDNMFIRHTFDVDGILKEGTNTVEVYFHSAIKTVEGKEKLGAAFTSERLHTRRMQCTYGWDWTMRFVTCGISAPCYLVFEEAPFVKNTYIYTSAVDSFGASICCDINFENFENGFSYNLEVISPDGKCVFETQRFVQESFATEEICVKHPQLWYPVGYGAQPLYTLKITIGEEVHTETFGIRTIRIMRNEDEVGSEEYKLCQKLKDTKSGKEYDHNEKFECFTTVVNGIRIFCNGADWAPCEPFLSETTDEKITRLLELAAEIGVNMLRVWGGGRFESRHFYDECDRLGILVTQDFLMACGRYPEYEEWFQKALVKEAQYAALELRNHPCLAWWTGDNENAVCGNDKMPDYKGRTSAIKCILPVLKRLDPMRKFLPSSPYGGDFYASKTVGTTHNTQFLSCIFDAIDNKTLIDYKEQYKSLLARFVAEEPTAGAVSLCSLRRMMTDKDIFDDDEMWYYHTKGNPALRHELHDYTITAAKKILGQFKDGEDRLFKLQYIQYEWMRVAFELMRRNMWFNSGILFWMLADCWPAASGWAIIDYYCLPKAAFYSFKRLANPMVLSIDEDEHGIKLYATNSKLSKSSGKAQFRLINIDDGSIKKQFEFNVEVDAQAVTILPIDISLSERELLVCDYLGEQTDRAFYKNGNLLIKKCDVNVEDSFENEITVSADRYVQAVRLEGPYIFSDNYFSLLPGERRVIKYRNAHGFEAEPVTITGYTLE